MLAVALAVSIDTKQVLFVVSALISSPTISANEVPPVDHCINPNKFFALVKLDATGSDNSNAPVVSPPSNVISI